MSSLSVLHEAEAVQGALPVVDAVGVRAEDLDVLEVEPDEADVRVELGDRPGARLGLPHGVGVLGVLDVRAVVLHRAAALAVGQVAAGAEA